MSADVKRHAWSARRMPQFRFVAWWVVLLLVHLLCVGYFAGFALTYRHLPKSNLTFQFRTYSIGIAESEYSKIAMIHEVVAAVHGFFIVLMVAGSLQVRRFVFYPKSRWLVHKLEAMLYRLTSLLCCGRRRVRPVSGTEDTPPRESSVSTPSRTYSGSFSRAGNFIFGRRGILGVDFVYFDHLLLVRELLETSLQTYQAYRMTRVLPRLWLIRIYVALLVANCWIIPILHRVYVDRHRLRRVMSLICDVVLDLVSSMGISFFIFCVYAPQYMDVRFGFPFNNWYNDEWFISVLQEFQMMVIVSWMDMASRLVFAFGVLQCMENLKAMLTHDQQRQSQASLRITSGQMHPGATSGIVPEPRLSLGSQSGPVASEFASQSSTPPVNRAVHFVLHVVSPACFIVWGIIILGIHSYAELQHINLPCKLPLRPWLTTKPACSLVEIDCYQPIVAGSSKSTVEDWTVFDPALAAGLVIRHCPDLTLPDSVQLLTGLTSVKTYNSTIVSWPETAGLSTVSHARLRAMYLIRTNFTSGVLPQGLSRKDFPQTFRSFFVSVTNLVELPDDLDTIWPKRMAISIEFASFTSIPQVVMRLSPGMISFSRNPIASVPASLFEIPTLGNLLLCYTALQELPRHVPKLGPRLYIIFVEGTNISTFWHWMDPFITRSLSYHKGFFNAYGTPFCQERAEILGGTRDRFSTGNLTELASIMDVSTPSRLAYTKAAVACSSDFRTLFPLAMQDQISAVR